MRGMIPSSRLAKSGEITDTINSEVIEERNHSD
jgi:hypothetical protein